MKCDNCTKKDTCFERLCWLMLLDITMKVTTILWRTDPRIVDAVFSLAEEHYRPLWVRVVAEAGLTESDSMEVLEGYMSLAGADFLRNTGLGGLIAKADRVNKRLQASTERKPEAKA